MILDDPKSLSILLASPLPVLSIVLMEKEKKKKKPPSKLQLT